MSRPVILAVADDPESLSLIERNLSDRYGPDYEIICRPSAQVALQVLERLRSEEADVAVVLADLWMREMTGVEFLAKAGELHRDAKRALLVTWGDRTISEPILRATAWGQIHNYLRKPFTTPDEHFHRLVTAFLDAWQQDRGHRFEALHVVDEARSTRSYELRDLLQRSGIPFGFREAGSEEGRALLQLAGLADGPLPVVRFNDGRVLVDPSITDLAKAFGVNVSPDGSEFDVIVVGAGPAGLAAAVYGASEGLSVLVVERQTYGGQAGSSSLIRNYLGFPHGLSGSELAARAYEQAWLFRTKFHFGVPVSGLLSDGDTRLVVLQDGAELRARAVVLAMGVAYRRLDIPSLERFTGSGVFYGAATTEAPALRGEQAHVIGGGNSAGQAAVHLAKYARRVTILVRGPSLAATMSNYLVNEIDAADNIDVRLNMEVVGGGGQAQLERLILRDRRSGAQETVPSAALLVLIGAQPHTSWLPAAVKRDERGFILTGTDLHSSGEHASGSPVTRQPHLLETSVSGVFAAGDVRHGSEKRVAAAVGEGSTAIRLIHQYLGELRELAVKE